MSRHPPNSPFGVRTHAPQVILFFQESDILSRNSKASWHASPDKREIERSKRSIRRRPSVQFMIQRLGDEIPQCHATVYGCDFCFPQQLVRQVDGRSHQYILA